MDLSNEMEVYKQIVAMVNKHHLWADFEKDYLIDFVNRK